MVVRLVFLYVLGLLAGDAHPFRKEQRDGDEGHQAKRKEKA